MKRLSIFVVVFLLFQIWNLNFVEGKEKIIEFSAPTIVKIQEYPEGIASQATFNGKLDDILYGTKALMVQNYYGSAFYYNNKVGAVDLRDGKVLWKHILDNIVIDVRRNENLFWILTLTSVYQIDINTGIIDWKFDHGGASFSDLPEGKYTQIVKVKDFSKSDRFIPSFDLDREKERLMIYNSPTSLQLIDVAKKELTKEFNLDIEHDKNEYNFVSFFEDGFLLKNGHMLSRYGEDFQHKIFEFRLRNYATEQAQIIEMTDGGKRIAIPGVHYSYLISADGQLIGRYDLEDSMLSFTLLGDKLLLEHMRGRIYCVDAKLEKIWEWKNPIVDNFLFFILPLRWSRAFDSSPVVFNHRGEKLFMIISTGVLYVVNSEGELVAKETLIKQPSVKRINDYFSVSSRLQPVIIDDQIHAIVSMVTGNIDRSERKFTITDYLVTLEIKK